MINVKTIINIRNMLKNIINHVSIKTQNTNSVFFPTGFPAKRRRKALAFTDDLAEDNDFEGLHAFSCAVSVVML